MKKLRKYYPSNQLRRFWQYNKGDLVAGSGLVYKKVGQELREVVGYYGSLYNWKSERQGKVYTTSIEAYFYAVDPIQEGGER